MLHVHCVCVSALFPTHGYEDIEIFMMSCPISFSMVMYGVSRDRQTWKRVLILSCRFLADGFENRVEITKFVDDFILFQENSNN